MLRRLSPSAATRAASAGFGQPRTLQRQSRSVRQRSPADAAARAASRGADSRQHRQHSELPAGSPRAAHTGPAPPASVSVPSPAWRPWSATHCATARSAPRRRSLQRRVVRIAQFARCHRAAAPRPAIEHLGDVPDRDARHAADAARRRKFPAHRIQQRGAPLARAGDTGLLPHARHQLAMTREISSITAKVTRYCASETAKLNRGGTKK